MAMLKKYFKCYRARMINTAYGISSVVVTQFNLLLCPVVRTRKLCQMVAYWSLRQWKAQTARPKSGHVQKVVTCGTFQL